MQKLLYIVYLALVAIIAWAIYKLPPAPEDEITEQIRWSLFEGLLTISGTGAMADYYNDDDANADDASPWYRYKDRITKVNIINGVTSIGSDAFASCSNLASITVPGSLAAIGENAFYDCTSLASITVDSANTVYASEDGVLFDKSKATIITYPAGKQELSYNIPASVTAIKSVAFLYCTNLTAITIPDAVMNIGEWAFAGCSNLSSIILPSSVTNITGGAFSDCTSLASITVDSGSTVYVSEDGILFDKSKTRIIAYPAAKAGSSYNIPNSVNAIGDDAFHSCSNLTSITISNSVTSIGNYAFEDCRSLTSITIPDSVTTIGEGAFGACSGLTSIFINAVTTLERFAFAGCINLRFVVTSGTIPPAMYSNSFENVSLSSATLAVPRGSKASYEASYGWKDFGSIIETDGSTKDHSLYIIK